MPCPCIPCASHYVATSGYPSMIFTFRAASPPGACPCCQEQGPGQPRQAQHRSNLPSALSPRHMVRAVCGRRCGSLAVCRCPIDGDDPAGMGVVGLSGSPSFVRGAGSWVYYRGGRACVMARCRHRSGCDCTEAKAIAGRLPGDVEHRPRRGSSWAGGRARELPARAGCTAHAIKL